MQRYSHGKVAPGGAQAMLGLEHYLHHCGLEEPLLHLIKLRASQINGCAYCLDMHWKDLKSIGEPDNRLYELDAWEETSFYTDRERAALAWIEAITLVSQGHVSDDVYEEVRAHFTEKEIFDLTIVGTTINAWNRIAVASRTPAGSYQPAAKATS